MMESLTLGWKNKTKRWIGYHTYQDLRTEDLDEKEKSQTKVRQEWIKKDFFGTLPIRIEDLTPSVVRMAHEAKIQYWRDKVKDLNEKAGIDKWFVVEEGRDFGMTNRKPAQYSDWSYPKDKEYPNTLFGFNVKKVLRFMGADAWTFDEALTALQRLGMAVSYEVIKEQLENGMKGIKTDPNLLEPDDVEELYIAKRAAF